LLLFGRLILVRCTEGERRAGGEVGGRGWGRMRGAVGFKGIPLSYLSLSTSSTLNISSRRVISEAISDCFGRRKGGEDF
jgi:hypothetical protein